MKVDGTLEVWLDVVVVVLDKLPVPVVVVELLVVGVVCVEVVVLDRVTA